MCIPICLGQWSACLILDVHPNSRSVSAKRWWNSLNNSMTCCCTSSGHSSIPEKSSLLNSLSNLSGVSSGFGGNLWPSVSIPGFSYLGMHCPLILFFAHTWVHLNPYLCAWCKRSGNYIGSFESPYFSALFEGWSFSPELLTKATATCLVPSFTVVYDLNYMHVMEVTNVLHGFSSNI